MSIYEVHLGSWRRPETGLPWYRSVADELADYCRTMTTHTWSFCP